MRIKADPFGVAVKKALAERGMTQTELAKEVGVSCGYLYLIVGGYRPVSKYKKRIAEYLKLDLKKIG